MATSCFSSRNGALIAGFAIATLLFAGGRSLIQSLVERDDERLSFELYRVSVDVLNKLANQQEPDFPDVLLGFLFMGGRGEILGSGGRFIENPAIQRPNSYWFEDGIVVYHRQVSGGGFASLARADAGSGRQILLWYNPSTLLAEQKRRNSGLYGGLVLLCGMVVAFTVLSRRLLLVQKRLDSQERLALLGQAARTISHEIQSPLAALDLHRQLAEKKLAENLAAIDVDTEKTTAEILRHLKIMATESARIRSVIRNVRKLIHPELGKPEPIDLAQFAADLIQRFPLPDGQSLELDPGNVQTLAYIDPTHLASILENLLNNSVQSQSQKGVNLPIRIALARDHAWVRLAVHDSGTGLDKYQLAHAFDPFFSAKPEGSGLGLSLARTLVRNAGGDLELQGHGRQGCSAILVLPAGEPDPWRPAPNDPEYEEPGRPA
ncbi:MAG: HAMP domain-containing sensor histidine kinase [Spirochaetota bacterium]